MVYFEPQVYLSLNFKKILIIVCWAELVISIRHFIL
jgi:hypothetical protein